MRSEVALDELETREIERVMLTALQMEDADLVLSCTVVDDAKIHRVNRDFLEHDWPTDVITFDLKEDESAVEGEGGVETEVLDGEVLVSVTTARREATDRDHDAATELLYYCVHGVLHLLGWDDHEEDERRAMLQRQGEILAAAGYRIEV